MQHGLRSHRIFFFALDFGKAGMLVVIVLIGRNSYKGEPAE